MIYLHPKTLRNMSSSLKNNPFLVGLYITFFCYLLTIKFAFLASLYVVVALYVVFALKIEYKKVAGFLAFFFVNIIISVLVGFNWRETSLLFWLMLIIPVFRSGFIERKQFLNFINSTYLIYIFLSILVSFQLIPAGFDSGHEELNQFDAVIGESEIKTLVGFGGSTADIDSYSVIVCLYNILFNPQQKYRLMMSVIAGLAALVTLRFTPLLSALIALFIVLGNLRYMQLSRTVYIGLLSVSFLVLFAFPQIEDLLFLVTHGRSEIWSIYINIMGEDSFDKFLFGYRQAHLPPIAVGVYQEEFSNAHSSFLRIFLHWGIFVYIFFMFFLLHLYFKTNSKKIIYMQSVIFTAAITNMNIFWNDNPIYFTILFYISYCYMKQERQVEPVNEYEYS